MKSRRTVRVLVVGLLVLAATGGLGFSAWAADPPATEGAAATPAVAGVISRGHELERAGKVAEALKLYEAELAKKPSVELYRAAGAALGKLKRYQEAITLVDKGIAANPKNAGLLNLCGLLHFQKGERDQAAARWRAALAIEPGNAFATQWLAKVAAPGAPNAAAPGGGESAMITEADLDSTRTLVGEETWLARIPTTFSVASPALPLAEQEKLAAELYVAMANTDKYELQKLIALHRQVIEQCPDTENAEESCWKLSNLYVLALDKPDYERCIEVLEHFVKRYPDSQGVPVAMNRLVTAYRESGNHAKVVELYKGMFASNPKLSDRDYVVYGLEYAKSLEAIGSKAEAKAMYENVVQRDTKGGSLEARVAKQRLADLGN